MKLELRRTIIYRGSPEWLEKTLSKSIVLGKPLDCGNGNSIRIDGEHWFPLESEQPVAVDVEREKSRG